MENKDEILSQDEVNALVTGVESGNVDTEDKSNPAEVKSIDFKNQEKIVRSKFPVLSRIHNRFAKKLTNSIYNLMSREFHIRDQELKIFNFNDFMLALTMPSSISIVRFHPLRGKGLIVVDTNLANLFIENYFGGDGRYNSPSEEREFTIMEQKILSQVFDLIAKDLRMAWQPILNLDAERVGHEMNPQLVNIAARNEVMMVTSFEFQYEQSKGNLHIIMPYSMLEPIKQDLDLGAARTDDDIDPNWIHSLKEEMMFVPLTVSSTLLKTNLQLNQIVQMNKGDVIFVDLPEEVTFEVENIACFSAKYGVSNDKYALKILRKIEG